MSKKSFFILLVIILLGIVLHYRYINEFPSHIHAWTQADRYALALKFTENKLNFFKPETYVLNHQFPGNWRDPGETGITAVDFPLHDYIPAIFMKISGIESPWIFRLYILVYSFSGLFFLYKLALLLTGNFYKSLFILLFAATSPVFVYYQAGFLPTVPCLSNAIIGLYFYSKHLKQGSRKDFVWGILFLTLSALSRTTFAIALVSVLIMEAFRAFRRETNMKHKIVPVVLSITLIAAYALYNSYLRKEYGSVFLGHFLAAAGIAEFKELFIRAINKWGTEYFSALHYLLFIVIVSLFVFYRFGRRKKQTNHRDKIVYLAILMLIGCLVFTVLMIRQFPNHDYYFLDTYFLPLIILLIILISYIPDFHAKHSGVFYILILTAVGIPIVLNAINTQEARRMTNYNDKTAITINNFRGSGTFLDSLGIDHNARMLVIDAVAPNIPFILMGRDGYAIMHVNGETIKDALAWDYDYIVVQNRFFLPEIHAGYPGFINEVRKIAGNGKITICTDEKTDQSLSEFLGLKGRKLFSKYP